MKTHRTLICLALTGIAALAPSLFSAEKVIASQWTAVPVLIDGTNQEWQDASLTAEKVSKAEYALRNDDKYLYILFVFKTLPALSTLEMSGMKVFYSLDGKKAKDNGFHFAKRSITADELIAHLEKKGETLTEEKKAGIRQQKAYMIYEGVPLDPSNPAAPQGAGPADPPTFRDRLTRAVSVVEFRIPLASLGQAGGTAAAPGSSLKLGFEWGGMNSEMRSAYMSRTAAAGAQASGNRGGGDLQDALRGDVDDSASLGGLGGRPDPMTKKHSFWISVKLASQGS